MQNVSFVAQAVDWIPEVLFDIVKAAYHHKGLSFVRIIQRCPEWLPKALDPWMHDPNKVQLLNHENGLQFSAGLSRVYKNQLEHDPSNIDRAREIASSTTSSRSGSCIATRMFPATRTCADPDKLRTPDLTRAGLNAELDKYTVWPQGAEQKVATKRRRAGAPSPKLRHHQQGRLIKTWKRTLKHTLLFF